MILELKDVKYGYRTKYRTVEVLKGVSCSFEKGKIYGIVGKSGSGKSTLLSLMAGVTLPEEGQVIYDGVPTSGTDLERYRRDCVSVIYQSFRLLPLLTAVENVMYPMELKGMKSRDAEKRAEELLSDVGIPSDTMRRFPAAMSGGEQQRVAIARALASGTGLILADEPTGNLDHENSVTIIDLLARLAREKDCCVIVVTHDVEVMGKMDVVYRIVDGRAEQAFAPRGARQ